MAMASGGVMARIRIGRPGASLEFWLGKWLEVHGVFRPILASLHKQEWRYSAFFSRGLRIVDPEVGGSTPPACTISFNVLVDISD